MLVSRMGVSISPSSLTCVDPASLPNAVAHEDRAAHLLLKEVAAVGNDRRDSGTNVVAANQSCMTGANAIDIRDRVQRAGREGPAVEACLAGARALRDGRSDQEQRENELRLPALAPVFPGLPSFHILGSFHHDVFTLAEVST